MGDAGWLLLAASHYSLEFSPFPLLKPRRVEPIYLNLIPNQDHQSRSRSQGQGQSRQDQNQSHQSNNRCR